MAVAYGVPAVISIVLGVGSATRRLPFDRLEAFGFISGAWGVWLQVRENVWNWPIQLISSALYVVVFLAARLYSDASLNVLLLRQQGLTQGAVARTLGITQGAVSRFEANAHRKLHDALATIAYATRHRIIVRNLRQERLTG